MNKKLITELRKVEDWYETHKAELVKGRKMVSELVPYIKKEHPDWDDLKCRVYATVKLGLVNN